MRKFLKYVLTLSFLFMLCSCGLNYKTETKDDQTTNTTETKCPECPKCLAQETSSNTNH